MISGGRRSWQHSKRETDKNIDRQYSATAGSSFQVLGLRVGSSCGRKAGGKWNEPGKRPPKGAGERSIRNRSVRLKTKNEPVVSRNIYHRA